jgi:hypothetical protein
VYGGAYQGLVKVEFAGFNIGFRSIDKAIDPFVSGRIPTAVGSNIEPNLHGHAS